MINDDKCLWGRLIQVLWFGLELWRMRAWIHIARVKEGEGSLG